MLLTINKRAKTQTMGKDVETMIKTTIGDSPQIHLEDNLLSKNLCKASSRCLRCGTTPNGKTNHKVSNFSFIYIRKDPGQNMVGPFT
jgi:hypothetical protein